MNKIYDWKEIQIFYDSDKTWRDIRATFGASYPTISKAIKRGDFITRTKSDARKILLTQPNSGHLHKGGTHKIFDWDAIQKFYDAGHSYREVSKEFKIGQATLVSYSAKGIFKNRTSSESIKMIRKNRPESYVMTELTKNKISKSRKQYLTDNPDKVPYLLNHYSKGDSFPEKYFESCLTDTNFVKKHRVGTYELDFADIERMIDLEIDGDQHFLDPRIALHDIGRNQCLIDKGWKIIRIKWSEFQKLNRCEKEEVIFMIKNTTPSQIRSLSLFGFDKVQAAGFEPA